jgi:predicted TIM-barrel fold metal-dependent hydrolase
MSLYIDADTHYLPLEWLDHLDSQAARDWISYKRDGSRIHVLRQGAPLITMPEDGYDLTKRTAVMDRHGFDRQVLIPENRPLIYEDDPEIGSSLARAYNDATAAAIKGHDRFIGVAWVYLADIEGAVKELERAVTTLGLPAVKVTGAVGDLHLGSRELEPFWAKVAELDVPVLAHGAARTSDAQPLNTALVGADRFGADYGFLGSALGFSFTYMLTMAHLIFSGTLDRFPTLRFGVFEAGVGWVPYLMNRLDIYYQDHLERAQKSRLVTELEHMPSEYIDRFYVTVHTKEPYLADMVRLVPNNLFMLGSDFYHGDPNGLWPSALQDLRVSGLSEEDQEKILEANPRRFFGV